MADSKEETVDFVYVIDCTGSMGSYIEQSKKDIQQMVNAMNEKFPSFKLRLGCVAYRDWCDGGDRLESQNFTENVGSFTNYVGNLKAKGGGDEPEDVLGGLNCAAGLSWSSKLRVLFHICDAPPHNKMYHDTHDDYPSGHPSDPNNYHEVVLDKFKSKNIHFCIAKLNNSVTKMINVFKGYADRIKLTMEERNVNNASELLNAVQQTLMILTKIRKEIKKTHDDMNTISNTLDGVKLESAELLNEVMNKMETVGNKIEDIIATTLPGIDTKISEAKREYDGLQSKHDVLIAYARNATSSDDIEKAEEDASELDISFTELNEKYSKAQDDLNKAIEELSEKQKELHKTDKGVTTNASKMTTVKSDISALTDKLDKMDESDDRNQLKKEIKKKLRDVSKLFSDNATMKSKVMKLRSELLKAFTEANERSKHINECKRDVQSKLNEIENLLDDLDDVVDGGEDDRT